MRNLAVIPARSGSKGLKDKNIRPLLGRPLMAYTIEAAADSHMFAEIMVSTDSESYAKIAREYGAKVPFLRSGETSGDGASSWDAVREVLRGYEEMGETFDTFCLLQPTSPLRGGEDIRKAYDVLLERNGTAVIAVCLAEHPPQWCGKLGADGDMEGFLPESGTAWQRQQYEPYYRVNGAVYIRDIDDFCRDGRLYKKGSYAYIMDQIRSVDIDTESDFAYAEMMMKALRGGIASGSIIVCALPHRRMRRCA